MSVLVCLVLDPTLNKPLQNFTGKHAAETIRNLVIATEQVRTYSL